MTTQDTDRGQVGIGTLIVFIAMVLVAGIAAGVLINTAGFLQTQAEATGEESTDLVSERVNVNSEVGVVGDSTAGTLDEIRLSITGAPGAGQIDLSETTIQAVGPGGQENLVFVDSTSGGSQVTQLSVPAIAASDTSVSISINYDNIDGLDAADTDQDLVLEYHAGGVSGAADDTTTVTGSSLDGQSFTFDSAGSGDSEINTGGSLSAGDEFVVDLQDTSDSSVLDTQVTQTVDSGSAAESTTTSGGNSVADLGANEFAVGEDGAFESSPVLNDQDDYTILINPAAGAFDDGTAFNQGQEATLDIVSPVGATTQVELRAPDLFSNNGEAVRL
ncbi:archaellin/type IV pilin N-terminal domain-containing protein [Halorubrum sp. AJ67]|uniref:archaellin/type IV pilin N-terminal domain-containing protein n=1 Tax=Halorubrum sp. AJ67 TaxID=1173487 RepID=UPI0003DBF58D|nr:archaellin/type IV pilin N-terminal domain-containing protein [Halorubrum sp. AJ67]CDK38043.1 flagellin [Halorubrum sp. AJ67]